MFYLDSNVIIGVSLKKTAEFSRIQALRLEY